MIFAYELPNGRLHTEKACFYDIMANEWDLGSSSQIIIFQRISMSMWGNVLKFLKMCMGEMVLGKEVRKEEDCGSSVMKRSFAWQTQGFIWKRKEKSLIVYVDVKQKLIVGEKYRKNVRNAKVISWELQHKLVVVNLDKKVPKKTVRKKTDRKKIDLEVE